jgi:hypothetical protein
MSMRISAFLGILASLICSFAFAQQPLSDGPGLYADGFNTPPPDHLAAGLAASARIRPLDRDGRPAVNGKVAMVSIGMSNTTQEYCAMLNPAPCEPWSFVGQAMLDPAVNHTTLVFVNGASGGQSAEFWDSPNEPNYNRIRDFDLVPSGLTEAQVQVGWVKVANPSPKVSLPSPQADAYRLVQQMGDIVRAMKTRYKNLQIVYFSSRVYGGYTTGSLNPEPYAYESGLAVKWLIAAQIEQKRSGKIDSLAGDLDYDSAAPWVAWGAYLWANGMQPRGDGLIWTRTDFQSDFTHPSTEGERKVGALLLSALKKDSVARSWFLSDASPPRRRAVH